MSTGKIGRASQWDGVTHAEVGRRELVQGRDVRVVGSARKEGVNVGEQRRHHCRNTRQGVLVGKTLEVPAIYTTLCLVLNER